MPDRMRMVLARLTGKSFCSGGKIARCAMVYLFLIAVLEAWTFVLQAAPHRKKLSFANVLNHQMTLARAGNQRRAARRQRKGLAEQAAANANSVNAMRAR